MVDQTRFFVTERTNIDANISSGVINANDLVICSDTHELIYVDENNNYFAITTTGEGVAELIEHLEETIANLQETAENSVVTGVKGSAERTYRKGDVNIGTADIGLNNVSNHTQVRGLASGTVENDIVVWGANGYIVKDSGVKAINGTVTANRLILNSSTPNSNKQFYITVNDNSELHAEEIINS